MGKVLIIKGADFSENGIPGKVNLPLYQGYMVSNPEAGNFGSIVVNESQSPIVQNIILTKVLIEHNSSIQIMVNNNNIIIDDLNTSYVASDENVDISVNNVVTNIVKYAHPLSSLNRQSDGTFIFTNDTNNDLYYYINFGYSNDGPALPVSNKECYSRSI